MASSKDPSKDETPSVAVGHDGKIDGIYRPRDSRRSWTPNDYAQLELAEQARPAPAQPDLPAPRRAQASPRAKLILIAIAAAAFVLPFAARWGVRVWREFTARPAKASGLLVIDSVPSGAHLFINDVEVGMTPYVAPNTYKPGSMIPARIIYPGAQEWSGTFPGGVDSSFTAEMQAK